MYYNVIGCLAWVGSMLCAGYFLQSWILTRFNFDLKNHLDPKAEAGGSYVDVNNYGVLNGSLVDVSNLSGDYSFEYQISATDFCTLSKSTITLTVNLVNPPVVSNQSFCITKGTTVTDLKFTHDGTVEWFESNEAPQPIMPTELVKSNQIYFAQAKDALSVLPYDTQQLSAFAHYVIARSF